MRVKNGSIIALNSGGLDSLVLLAYLKSLRYNVQALYVYYGHISNGPEERAAIAMCEYYKIPLHRENVCLSIWNKCDFFQNPLSKNCWVPNRNFTLFAIAAAYCDALSIPNMGLAWDGFENSKRELLSVGTDKHRTFVERITKAFDEGSDLGWYKNYNLTTVAPFLNKTKVQIAKMGLDLKVPFELSWSCFQAKEQPCNECVKCKEREALVSMGVPNKFDISKR